MAPVTALPRAAALAASTRERFALTPPVHCAMFALDIAAFGSRRRADVQTHLREALYQITQDSCRAAGIPWDLCHHEDRGDGLLFIAPADIGAEALFDPLVAHLRAGLRRYHTLASPDAAFRVRMAVHAGYIHQDTHGASGNALIHLFRLLDAPEFKAAMTRARADFALLVSDYLYDEVIRFGPGLVEPQLYRPITVTTKEASRSAWLWLHEPPPTEHPFSLTEEEVEIARLLAAGWSRKRIAAACGLTPAAVEDHIRHVIAELSLTTSSTAEIRAMFPARSRPASPRRRRQQKLPPSQT